MTHHKSEINKLKFQLLASDILYYELCDGILNSKLEYVFTKNVHDIVIFVLTSRFLQDSKT